MLVEVETVDLSLPYVARTDGIHLSNIIKCIATDTGILKAEFLEDLSLVGDHTIITDRVALLRISIGLAWEQFYIPMIPDVIDHPGEMEAAGVYMNPDGESTSVILIEEEKDKWKRVLRHIVHEVKATYKSTKTVGMLDTQSTWMWRAQLMAYCRAKGTLHGWLHVLFLCGNYKFPITPELKIFKVTFTQAELDDNWEIMTGYRDLRLAGGQLS